MKKLLFVWLILASFEVTASTWEGDGRIYSEESGQTGYFQMRITSDDNGNLKGYYYYTKSGADSKIFLEGTYSEKGGSLKTTANSGLTETFIGQFKPGEDESQFSGKWYGKHVIDGESPSGYLFEVTIKGWPEGAEWGNNPFADKSISCQEMKDNPAVIFSNGVDLGSGYGSPIDFDYKCPKSLNSLPFLSQLIGEASFIRSPSALPRSCTGSIVYAQRRYFGYRLAQLGYYPQYKSTGRSKNLGMEYFREWAYQSPYNWEIYNQYLEELGSVKPLLIDWYMDNHEVNQETATSYAHDALTTISNWGFGSYYYSWEPQQLVPYTYDAISGESTNFINEINTASKEQKLNSLNRLVRHNTDIGLIELLLNKIDDPNIEKRSETPLSNALHNPKALELTLKKGFNPDHQNEFGKTALYYAIQLNLLESATMLLDHGANINHGYQLEFDDPWSCLGIEQWNRSPLMHAAQHSDTEMLNMLISRGAELTIADSKGFTPIDYAIDNNRPDNVSYLINAIRDGISKDKQNIINRLNIKGEEAYQQKKYQEAYDFFIKASEHDEASINIKILNNLAITALKLGDYKAALKSSERVINIDANKRTLASAYFNYGKACTYLLSEKKSRYFDDKEYCGSSLLGYYVNAYDAYPTKSRAKVIIDNLKSRPVEQDLYTISCFEEPSTNIEAVRVVGNHLYILGSPSLNHQSIKYTNQDSDAILDSMFELNKTYNISEDQYLYVLSSINSDLKELFIDDYVCSKK